MKRKQNNGYSLVELIVVIAIMAVLMTILVPTLLTYVEKSRLQKDDSAMSEVVNSVRLALADEVVYDECLACKETGIPGAYVSTQDKERAPLSTADEDKITGMYITYSPTLGKYVTANGIINSNDTKTVQGTCRELYAQLVSSIGHDISITSKTYRNSNYTVFIEMNNVTQPINVYGRWDGTNLTADSVAVQEEQHEFAEDAETREHYCTLHPDDASERHMPQIHDDSGVCAYEGCNLDVSEPEFEMPDFIVKGALINITSSGIIPTPRGSDGKIIISLDTYRVIGINVNDNANHIEVVRMKNEACLYYPYTSSTTTYNGKSILKYEGSNLEKELSASYGFIDYSILPYIIPQPNLTQSIWSYSRTQNSNATINCSNGSYTRIGEIKVDSTDSNPPYVYLLDWDDIVDYLDENGDQKLDSTEANGISEMVNGTIWVRSAYYDSSSKAFVTVPVRPGMMGVVSSTAPNYARATFVMNVEGFLKSRS